MSEWQPILSAPRDGTPILLWAEAWDMTWGIQIGHSNGSGWLTLEGSVPDNDEDFDPEAEVAHDAEIDEDANAGPTHWMPLPAPPRS
jgi:Protein of unknown function (DUF551)